jgi:acyl-CoA thioesterase
MTPFEALYGRSPPSVTSYISGSAQIAAVDDTLTRRMQLSHLLKENLRKAQQRITSLANAHRFDRNFEVGDWVMLKLQPYRQPYRKHTGQHVQVIYIFSFQGHLSNFYLF